MGPKPKRLNALNFSGHLDGHVIQSEPMKGNEMFAGMAGRHLL